MSIQRLSRDFINVFTLVTEPSQSFSSASFTDDILGIYQGVTGSVFLMPNRVKSIKAQRSEFGNPGDTSEMFVFS